MNTFVCTICGQESPKEELLSFEGEELCAACAEEHTLFCSHCGRRIWQDNNAGDCAVPLCESCYENHYTNCEICGRLIAYEDTYYTDDDDDNDSPLCQNCYHNHPQAHSIEEYYYKPEPCFHGDGTRFFGVELEIDEGGETAYNARTFLELANANAEEHIYCKRDGSLNEGIELVTHPMTLKYHQHHMPWAPVLQEAVKLGYRSHQARTCGLHVHVNRSAFGETAEEQDTVIARILFFFEKHWEEMLKFSRRTQRQLDRWAARYGYKEQPGEILEHAKKNSCNGRYSAVNLTNYATVEFRMFNGTLKYNTLIATLQMLDRICDVAISMSDEQLKAMSWTSFVGDCTEPELIQYLKERRLYVNEPVNAEVDL